LWRLWSSAPDVPSPGQREPAPHPRAPRPDPQGGSSEPERAREPQREGWPPAEHPCPQEASVWNSSRPQPSLKRGRLLAWFSPWPWPTDPEPLPRLTLQPCLLAPEPWQSSLLSQD